MEETPDSPSYELTLYNSKAKLIAHSLLFTVMGGFFLWIGISEVSLVLILAGVFFVVVLIVTGSKLSDSTRRVVINPDGITSATWEWKTIPWDEIKAVSIITFRYQSALQIELVDKDKYFKQMSTAQHGMHQVNDWLGGGHINLNTQGLKGSVEDLLEHIFYLKSSGKISVSLPSVEGNGYFVDSGKL